MTQVGFALSCLLAALGEGAYVPGGMEVSLSWLTAFPTGLQLRRVVDQGLLSWPSPKLSTKLIFSAKVYNSWAATSSQGTQCAQNQFVE